jgi:hypothetical protein
VVVKGLTEGVEAYEVLGWPGISEGLVCAAPRREP